jgi:hypothetical protein
MGAVAGLMFVLFVDLKIMRAGGLIACSLQRCCSGAFRNDPLVSKPSKSIIPAYFCLFLCHIAKVNLQKPRRNPESSFSEFRSFGGKNTESERNSRIPVGIPPEFAT